MTDLLWWIAVPVGSFIIAAAVIWFIRLFRDGMSM